MASSWSLSDRPSVVVTGASSGIGEQCAYCFARAGARLSLLARRKDRLARIANRARELGADAHPTAVDIGDDEAARRAIGEAESRFEAIDVLVNNAGFGLYAPIESVPRADIERLFAVNTFGALATIQAALPGMRRRGRGLIINVSSVVGKRALPMSGAYAASKYALHGLSDALRVELRGTGVELSVVCPGFTATEFSDKVLDYGAERSAPVARAMSAEAVAEVIVGCARDPKPEIFLTSKGKTLVWLQRLSPRLTDWACARTIPVRLPT